MRNFVRSQKGRVATESDQMRRRLSKYQRPGACWLRERQYRIPPPTVTRRSGKEQEAYFDQDDRRSAWPLAAGQRDAVAGTKERVALLPYCAAVPALAIFQAASLARPPARWLAGWLVGWAGWAGWMAKLVACS